jgi:hypothetical protein
LANALYVSGPIICKFRPKFNNINDMGGQKSSGTADANKGSGPGHQIEGDTAMTTLTINNIHTAAFAQANRAPKKNVAHLRTMLGGLSDHASLVDSTSGVVLRAGLAAIPFAMLAWIFVAV